MVKPHWESGCVSLTLFFDGDAELVGGVEVCVCVDGLSGLGDVCADVECGEVGISGGCGEVWGVLVGEADVGGEFVGGFGEVE